MRLSTVARLSATLLGIALVAPRPFLLGQQSEREPAAYRTALDRLAQGDTAGAVADLSEAVRLAPRFAPAFLRLGAVLSAQAGEGSADLSLRLEARQALDRAAELLGDDPEVLLEYGLLLLKQRLRVDARRVLDRAERAAERRAAQLLPADAARLHFALGRMYETWWEDWMDLIDLPWGSPRILRCARIPDPLPGDLKAAFVYAAPFCPREWNIVADGAIPLADMKWDERALMMAHFRRTLEADPGHVEAAVRLLGHIADDAAWEEYDAVARRLERTAPEDARVHLFKGLGLHERGLDGAADRAFRRALALLQPADRQAFHNVARLLPRAAGAQYAAMDSGARAEVARVFFAARDPSFLSEVEERRLEHYARVAWAELKFSDPAGGPHGWDSDRGQIWIRYGRPWRLLQCCYGGGGRAVFWAYSREGPVFVFFRRLTYRYARLTEQAQWLADDAAVRTPDSYHPRIITAVHPLPHQLIRLRGRSPEQSRVEIYAAVPVDSLHAGPADSLEAGVFVFDRAYRPLWSHRHGLLATSGAATYAFDVLPGTYWYGLEARPPGPEAEPRALARARDSLVVPGFAPGHLSVSDLLLADSLAAVVPFVTRRGDLRLWPSRTLEFPSGAPVHVYFEVYGITAEPDGTGRYRVQLTVEDARRRGVVERVMRGIEELFRRTGRPAAIEWQREVRVADDRTVDFLRVELPALPAGPYTVALRITDELGGETATASRVFWVR